MDDQQESLAWDRVGRFLEDTGTTAMDIAQRNVDLWSSVSENLRKGEKYRADDMAGDVARSMVVAMDNLDAIWTAVGRNRMDGPGNQVGTVFLLFRVIEGGGHSIPDPAFLPVDQRNRSTQLPNKAKVRLSMGCANRAAAGDLDRSLQTLEACLTATLAEKGSSYLLEATNTRPPNRFAAPAEGAVAGLLPGFYDGLVYLSNPPIALADLRIIVESPDELD